MISAMMISSSLSETVIVLRPIEQELVMIPVLSTLMWRD
jgi:hypothetical protein